MFNRKIVEYIWEKLKQFVPCTLAKENISLTLNSITVCMKVI